MLQCVFECRYKTLLFLWAHCFSVRSFTRNSIRLVYAAFNGLDVGSRVFDDNSLCISEKNPQGISQAPWKGTVVTVLKSVGEKNLDRQPFVL